ncbi:NUDIX domain-containing protein [Phaeobacter marinintestinus]|uniref:NUDIX domain-containing protein n=1 Tax=Falsiphaeobacter marinintestinus TaxID=1492905 RepID=UPI0011B75244|nr:NUDIX domain-containing protein [Phaeobacter marinintestinus]
MNDLFFYGTLCYAPLLELVLGRKDVETAEAVLPGHLVTWVHNQPFPIIQVQSDATARGVLVRGLTEDDRARLSFYEGAFDYDLKPLEVTLPQGEKANAQVFFPSSNQWVPGADWHLEDWISKWGPLSLRAAEEVMAFFGRLTAEEAAERLPSIRIRAAAWLAAQNRPADPNRDIDTDVVVLNHRRAYLNFFGVEEADLRFRRHDGTMSTPLNRGALMVGQAAVVLPYDPVRDCVLLIEQFRAPVFMCGDRSPWVWEPVAGLVDPGETPDQSAHREAMEEAGLTLKAIEKAGEVYSSTGSSSEYLHLYIGLADLTDTTDTGGLAEEGEDIRSQIITYDALMDGIDAHVYRDMPLVTTALWLARHRDRLRKIA